MARRPVFPPSEHSSLSRKGSKGYAPGRARQKGKGIRMPLYEHVFLGAPGRQRPAGRRTDRPAQRRHRADGRQGRQGRAMGREVALLSPAQEPQGALHAAQCRCAAAVLNEIERQERLNEDVLRYLTVRVDEHEEGPSAMMRKVDRDRERDDRGLAFVIATAAAADFAVIGDRGGGGGFRGDRDRDRESRRAARCVRRRSDRAGWRSNGHEPSRLPKRRPAGRSSAAARPVRSRAPMRPRSTTRTCGSCSATSPSAARSCRAASPQCRRRSSASWRRSPSSAHVFSGLLPYVIR